MGYSSQLRSTSLYMVVFLSDYQFDNPPHTLCGYIDNITKKFFRQVFCMQIIYMSVTGVQIPWKGSGITLFSSHSNSSRCCHRDRTYEFFQFIRIQYLLQQFDHWTNPIFVRSQKQNAEVLSRWVNTNIAKAFIRSNQKSFLTLYSNP